MIRRQKVAPFKQEQILLINPLYNSDVCTMSKCLTVARVTNGKEHE